MNLISDSFSRVYYSTIDNLLEMPSYVCQPRGMKIHEQLFYTFELLNPRNRLIISKARNPHYGFAVGEFLWYFSGKNDLETMVYYNKRMKNYSDDGKTLNSAYGYRVLGKHSSFSHDQISSVVNKLIKDKDSRQAIVHINYDKDQSIETKDVPCTMSWTFFIRNNELIMKAYMRSNDVIMGTIYDVFSFTLFHEYVFNRLKLYYHELSLGFYHHCVDSMHLYETNFDMANAMVKECKDSCYKDTINRNSMKPFDNNELERLVEDEEKLRKQKVPLIDLTKYKNETVSWMAEELNKHSEKRKQQNAK